MLDLFYSSDSTDEKGKFNGFYLMCRQNETCSQGVFKYDYPKSDAEAMRGIVDRLNASVRRTVAEEIGKAMLLITERKSAK